MAKKISSSRINDMRGSAKDRKARKLWLLSPAAGFGGNGTMVPCAMKIDARCQEIVDFESMEVDRIVPGCFGGRYVRGNVRPSCWICNNTASHEQKRELAAVSA